MQVATTDTVLGNFDDIEFEYYGTTTKFSTRDGEFYVMTADETGAQREFRIAYAGIKDTFPKEMSTLTDLYRLDLGGNNFRGTLMTEYGLMTSLSWLALNDNDFSGTIPTEFGNLVNMTRFSIKDTLVNGTIPAELGYMTRLQDLALSQTGLSGRAPEEVCALRLLEMTLFVTDCEEEVGGKWKGVDCPVDDCCTFCRRGDERVKKVPPK